MTTVADLEHLGTESFDVMSSGVRYVAPEAIGFFGRVLGFGAKEVAVVAPSLEADAVALVPGGTEVALAWKIASNPFVHLLVAVALVFAAYGIGRWRGYDAGYAEEGKQVEIANAAARADRDAATARQAEIAAAAKRTADARIAAIAAQRDRANARLANLPVTRKCSGVVVDAIHGVGQP